MKKEYWLNKWELGHTAFHAQEVNNELITYFPQLHLREDDCILVPLCGKSKDMLWLLNQGLRVIGVELSRLACLAFFAETGLPYHITEQGQFVRYQSGRLEIWCGDFFALPSNAFPNIHAVFDCKALIAMPDDMRQLYMQHLLKLTNKQTRYLLMTIESPDHVYGPPFSVHQAEIQTLYGPDYILEAVQCNKAKTIPPHLLEKGYRSILEATYLIHQV